MYTHICRFCKRTLIFKKKGQIGAHVRNCIENPNREQAFKLLALRVKETRKQKRLKNIELYNLNPKHCEECRKILTYNNKNKQFCSHSCSAKHSNKKRGPHTEETKNKISNKLKGHISKCKGKIRAPRIKKICLNEKCNKEFEVYAHFQEQRKFCCSKCVYQSTFFRELKSKQTKHTYEQGKKVYGGTTKWYVVETSNGKTKVQGTYEVRVCKILDKWKKEGKIKDWEYTKDRFEYFNKNGEKHLYLLDFKIFTLNNDFYYVECKGYQAENDLYKWESIRNKGYKLEVWFKKDIEERENK